MRHRGESNKETSRVPPCLPHLVHVMVLKQCFVSFKQVFLSELLYAGNAEEPKFLSESSVSKNNQFKIISISKRHILGWQTLLSLTLLLSLLTPWKPPS